jgi:hypothetical protein
VQNLMQLGGCINFLRPFILSRVSGPIRFLTADQKRVNVCEELRQIASDEGNLLVQGYHWRRELDLRL